MLSTILVERSKRRPILIVWLKRTKPSLTSPGKIMVRQSGHPAKAGLWPTTDRKGLSDFFVRAFRLTSPYFSTSRPVLKLCLELAQAHNYFKNWHLELGSTRATSKLSIKWQIIQLIKYEI